MAYPKHFAVEVGGGKAEYITRLSQRAFARLTNAVKSDDESGGCPDRLVFALEAANFLERSEEFSIASHVKRSRFSSVESLLQSLVPD